MIDLSNITVVIVALAPIVFVLSIWVVECLVNKLVLAGSWVLGSFGLIVMGEDI